MGMTKLWRLHTEIMGYIYYMRFETEMQQRQVNRKA